MNPSLYKPAPAVTAAKKVGGFMAGALPTLAKTAMNASPTVNVAKIGAGLLKPLVTQQMAKPQMVTGNPALNPSPSFSTQPQSMGQRANFPGLSSQTSTPNTLSPSQAFTPPPTPATNVPKTVGTTPSAPSQSPTQTYSAPATQQNPMQNPMQNPNATWQNGGTQLSPQGSQQTQNAQPLSTPATQPSMNNSYGGLIQQLVGQAYNTQPVDTANQQLQQLHNQYAQAVGNIQSQAIPLEFQQGRQQVLANQYASQEAAAQSALTNAMGIRGQNIGAIQTALAAMKPNILSGGQYMADPTDLSGNSFGAGLDRQRMVDNFNFNTTQSQSFAGSAAQLETPMRSLAGLGTLVSGYVDAIKANPYTSGKANAAINSYLSEANPSQYKALVAAATEAKNLIAQIAGSGADIIPSDLTASAQSMDITNMSAPEIQQFIDAVNQLGQPRLAALQHSASAASQSGYTPYAGSPATQNPSFAPDPANQNLFPGFPTTNNRAAQAGLGMLNGVLDTGHAASAVIGGLAEKFFKLL